MFHLSVYLPLLRYSHATRKERRTYHSILTHLPTGRKFHFQSRKAGMEAQRAYAAAVAEGRMTILPPMPLDAAA